MKKFFGYLFLAFGMAFALSYFQNSSVNALDGSYDDAIMGQSSHIDQDENKIEEFTEKLEELKAEFDCVTERRGKGLMQGLVITKPIKEINDRAIEEGLLIIQAQGNVIRFVPPLIVEKEHIDQMVEKMRRILA